MPKFPEIKPFRVKLNDIPYSVIFSSSSKELAPQDMGACSHPLKPDPTIIIRQHPSQREIMETIIHEITHGGCWPICERLVNQIAKVNTKILYDKLKFRMSDG